MFKKYTFGILLLAVAGTITFLAVLVSFQEHPSDEVAPIVLDRTTSSNSQTTPHTENTNDASHQTEQEMAPENTINQTPTTNNTRTDSPAPPVIEQAPAPVLPPAPEVQHYPAKADIDDADDDIETTEDDD